VVLLAFGVREGSDKVSPPARTTSYPTPGSRQVTGDAMALRLLIAPAPVIVLNRRHICYHTYTLTIPHTYHYHTTTLPLSYYYLTITLSLILLYLAIGKFNCFFFFSGNNNILFLFLFYCFFFLFLRLLIDFCFFFNIIIVFYVLYSLFRKRW
jgi:hypothetical protein